MTKKAPVQKKLRVFPIALGTLGDFLQVFIQPSAERLWRAKLTARSNFKAPRFVFFFSSSLPIASPQLHLREVCRKIQDFFKNVS